MANDTISTATPKQRHEAEQLRLSQEAQEWNEKVQKKHATRDEQVLKKVEQERADAKKQAKEKYERYVFAPMDHFHARCTQGAYIGVVNWGTQS